MSSGTLLDRSTPHGISRETALEGLFRIGIASCFIGHGAFGIITKEAWLPYFGLVGIAPDTAFVLMPLVGVMDIAAGIIGLVSPRRAVFVYMTVWAAWTALLRPLTGESGWEFIERAGNFGVPLAFLAAVGFGTPRKWFERVHIRSLSPLNVARVSMVLRVTTVMLLAGHGALAITGANGLAAMHLAALGWSPDMAGVLGGVEIGLAAAVAIQVSPTLLVAVAGWKLATELLFPVAGAPWWEVVERGGSYAAPLLLALLLPITNAPSSAHDRVWT